MNVRNIQTTLDKGFSDSWVNEQSVSKESPRAEISPDTAELGHVSCCSVTSALTMHGLDEQSSKGTYPLRQNCINRTGKGKERSCFLHLPSWKSNQRQSSHLKNAFTFTGFGSYFVWKLYKHHYWLVFREQEHVSYLESGARTTTQFQNGTQLERLTHQKASHFTGGETWLLRNLFFQGDGISWKPEEK